MKRLYTFISFAALSALVASCSLADGKGLDISDENKSLNGEEIAKNAVYLRNSSPSGVVSVVAKIAGVSHNVILSLASPAQKDVSVTLSVDKEPLEKYNKANGFSYTSINPEDVSFKTDNDTEGENGTITVTIPKGGTTAGITISVGVLDNNKYPTTQRYAIPIKVVKTDSEYPILSNANFTIIKLDREISTSVFHFISFDKGGYTQTFKPKDASKVNTLKEFTFQYIAQFDQLTGNNQTTASNSHGFYNRISKNSGLQIKSEGRDGADTWTNVPVSSGRWFHVSYVYRDFVNYGKLEVYQDGSLAKTFTTSPMSLGEKGWGFGNENLDYFYLREIRIWDRALTPAEILDMYDLPIDPETKGLISYFPMTRESYDEAKGGFQDLTGNWVWEMQDGVKWEFVDNVLIPSDRVTIQDTNN